MAWYIYLLIGLGAVVALILIMIAATNGHVKVECSVDVNAPVEKPFGLVGDLKNWKQWSPWDKIDPDKQDNFSDPSSGEGAWNAWKSNHKHVGNGKMTLTKYTENKHTEQTMEFEKWGNNSADMYFESTGDNTSKVRWVMEQDLKGFAKLFKGMMKKMLNKQFNEGLSEIKRISEAA